MAIAGIHVDFFQASDSTILVRLDRQAGSEAEVNEDVLALASHLQQQSRSLGVHNLHPAHPTILIDFNPLITSHADIETAIRGQLQAPIQSLPRKKDVEIPVCYGGPFGPDLEDVAQLTNLTPAQVIDTHSSVSYRVYFLGFAPGFPYLGGMSPRIAVPKLEAPRKEVAAGSVGIADDQTGIYPVASPGGWRLIGRTPLRLFNPDEANPALIYPGDTIRFRAITLQEYERALR